jgi:integrase/recombinase XerD
LRIIQEISGHRNLEQLQKYLEVHPNQVTGAIASLSMLSPIGKGSFADPQGQTVDFLSLDDSLASEVAKKHGL